MKLFKKEKKQEVELEVQTTLNTDIEELFEDALVEHDETETNEEE